ncbi:MAG: hypothetical protein JO033_20170 [Acidobacteriaceae bacterium]|nr:hypothetical protein [Acidobacteriaceae bacterium]
MKVLAGDFDMSSTKVQLTDRSGVERIVSQAIASSDCADLFKSTFRTFFLGNGNRTVERDNRRGANLH